MSLGVLPAVSFQKRFMRKKKKKLDTEESFFFFFFCFKHLKSLSTAAF